ncbi:alpha/beta fold hydrolase [Rhodococcus sp. 114MFTsu3.1]|uniref:alpha/beta fold hydrolase n=1 Tax=Rhodococcus sp. 114MFTsu3.1 TaxID=1172184 RepID=UPI000373393B|nr:MULTISPECIES: alpha/beta hydrolase [unclassified Rhodococcus (in: high G+C Gram-positive bacteria)]OZC92947.1 alpha/beta hydrolase [Rhodococcus sp. 06-418-1B]
METPDGTLPQPETVVVDGVSIATYVIEPPTEAVGDVVICHGTPWSAAVWAGVAHHLSRDHRVHLWDMPGYGRSGTLDAAVDLDTQMSRLARLLSLWGVNRPHVIAHDIGGAVALGAHVLHGIDYASLFLWDIVTLDPWGSPFFKLVAEHTEVFGALPAPLHAALVREYIAGAARRPLSSEWLEALTGPWLGEVGQPGFYRQIAALRPDHTQPLVRKLAEVRCRTRIGWGTDDPWIPVEQATRLRQSLPGEPAVITLDGVGHLAPIESSADVCRAVDGWIR